MKWHRKTSYTDGNGNTVYIKTRRERALSTEETTAVGATVGEATNWVRNTISVMQTPWEGLGNATKSKVQDAAEAFFATTEWKKLPYGGLSDNQVRKLIAKLELILNGLNCSEMNIKVGNDAETGGRTGRVNVHLTKGFGGTISGSTSVFSLKQAMGLPVNVSMRMGDIAVAKSELDDLTKLTILIIHEASHKYAGTWDHEYAGSKQRVNDIDTAQCLENADSYGHFCAMVEGQI